MGNVNSSRPSICDESAIPANKWVDWFPYYRPALENATANCFQALHDHPLANTVDGDIGPGRSQCPNAYDLITCVQDSLPATIQLNNAAAQVLLGLTPTILSVLSPSVGELSMLSSTRPVLSLLLSLGSPAVYAIRAMDYDNPLDTLKGRQDPLNKPTLFTQKRVQRQGFREAFISLCQYLLVLVCVVNVVYTGWQIGLQTIVVWKAGYSSLVFLWSTLAAVAHGTAATGWHMSRTMHTVRKNDQESGHGRVCGLGAWTRFLKEEVTICAAKRRRNYLACEQQEAVVPLFLNLAASVMGVILILYGTATFSSLLFIANLDALTVVARYLVSTLLCRLVVMFELAGLAAVEVDTDGDDSHEKVAVRADLKHAITM
jgi:hypothetical protein